MYTQESRQEQEQHQQKQQLHNNNSTTMTQSCAGRIFGLLAILAVIGVAAYLGVYFIGGSNKASEIPEDVKNLLPQELLYRSEDPFENITGTSRWQDAGGGLELTILNALDQQWYPYFKIAVDEWDNGTPDALTLSTQVATAESACTAVTGVMKVCNGDYGNTDWKGINTVLLENGYITSSAARMNDHFFISGSDADKRQYTMCHEIGHGFGLPHTDEKYWNRDLGNCLDYTNNFEGNKTPDAYLYNYLKDLYGIVGTNSTGVPVAQSNTNSGTYAPSSNTGGRRLKHRPDGRRHLFESVESEARRRELLFRWNEIDSLVVSGFVGSKRDGWRLLHQTAYGEAHEIDLGDNYSVQVHLLLA